jgi:hypothetical protein
MKGVLSAKSYHSRLETTSIGPSATSPALNGGNNQTATPPGEERRCI